jgi:hypothetical protein
VPGTPFPPAPAPGGVVDPHGIGVAMGRLGGNGRRAGRVALAVLAASLEPGENVVVLAQGQFRGAAGVVALVPGRVLLVNDRQWKPDVVSLAVDPALAVHGWQDDRSASLTFVAGDRHEVVSRILDRGLAIELAQRVREQAGSGAPRPPPPPPSL